MKNAKELEKKLKYNFINKTLLQQALTRQSAITEQIEGAAKHSYQALELLGDAALKFALARYFAEKYPDFSEEKMHESIKKLVGNEDVLPEIGKKLNLEDFLIKGKGEGNITPKMYADGVEAILGAISLDNKSQKALFRIVLDLWKPYIDKLFLTAITPTNLQKMEIKDNNTIKNPVSKSTTLIFSQELQKPSSSVKLNNLQKIEPLPPKTQLPQRLFSSLGNGATPEKFAEYIKKEVKDVNQKNIGKRGDTALMILLRHKKLREGKEISKIQVLTECGASWDTKNNKGESANDLAKKHDGELIKKLKVPKN